MSTATAIEKKRSTTKKRLIIVEDIVQEEPKVVLPQKSIWLQMRRIPKTRTPPIVWEGIEDISDDEHDTPQACGRRLSQLKATRDRIQIQHYVNRLEDLQDAGLLLNW
jgi:hypothetical protein